MIWNICLILGIIMLLFGVSFFAYMRKKGKRNFLYLGGAVFLAAVILCFPVKLLEDSWGYALCMSVSHSIRMFVVDTGISDITAFLTPELLGGGFHIYKVLICVLYICAPMFTVGLILQYFSHFFENLRLMMRGNRDLFVFSELNEQSYLAAKNLWEKAKNKNEIALVFCQTEEKDMLNQVLEDKARELQAVFMAKEMEQLKLDDKKRHISYFEISENEEVNLEHSIQMIELLKGHATSNSALYCYASGPEAEILIDSKDKGNLRVILVDEVRDAVYEHLYEYPLFCNLLPPEESEKRQKIGVLIMGGGKTGIEFLKAATWCGQMKHFDLEIHLLDLRGNQIRDRLQNDYPELLGDRSPYNIQIHEVDVFGHMTEELLDQLKDINYCVAALGDDEDNIKIALYLRRYFCRKNTSVKPVVCAHIYGEKKRQAVMEMYETTRVKGGRVSYEIIPFGNSGKMFREETDAPFVAEYLSLGVHFYYYRLGKDASAEERQSALQSYYAKQGNRRSSVANGLHISYKLWELGMSIARVPEDPKQRALFEQYISPVNFLEQTEGKLQGYYDLEHDRWMAFTRTEGWRLATYNSGSFDDVKACYESYCEVFKNQNHLAKMHPALVPLEASYPGEAILIDVENMMGDVNDALGIGKYHPDYVNSDVELINHIDEIVSGEWCGEQGLMIQGRHIRPHQCVICRREDYQYYKKQIKQEA